MKTSITLIACCGPKLSTPTAAKDLYRSPLFKKARAHAEAVGNPWFILSALHGLVDPETITAPYNHKLRTGDDGWGWRVFEQLANLNLRDCAFLVLAGERYVSPLRTVGLTLVTPLAGLGIGEQLAWFGKIPKKLLNQTPKIALSR